MRKWTHKRRRGQPDDRAISSTPASQSRFRSSALIRLLTPSVDHQRRRAAEGSYVYDPIATVIPERLRDKLKPTCTPRSCRTTPLAFCSLATFGPPTKANPAPTAV